MDVIKAKGKYIYEYHKDEKFIGFATKGGHNKYASGTYSVCKDGSYHFGFTYANSLAFLAGKPPNTVCKMFSSEGKC